MADRLFSLNFAWNIFFIDTSFFFFFSLFTSSLISYRKFRDDSHPFRHPICPWLLPIIPFRKGYASGKDVPGHFYTLSQWIRSLNQIWFGQKLLIELTVSKKSFWRCLGNRFVETVLKLSSWSITHSYKQWYGRWFDSTATLQDNKTMSYLLNRFLLDSIEISSCSVFLNIRLLSKNIEKIRNFVSLYLDVRIFALSRYTLSFLFFSFLKKNKKHSQESEVSFGNIDSFLDSKRETSR